MTTLEGPFIDAVEDARSVPVVLGSLSEAKDRVVLLSVRVSVEPADVVLLLGQAEVTNDMGVNVGFGRYVTRGASPTDVVGVQLVPANMDNIMPGNHHRSEDFWAVDSGAHGTFYYNLVAYAVSSVRAGSLTVQQRYGRLVALKFKR